VGNISTQSQKILKKTDSSPIYSLGYAHSAPWGGGLLG